MWASSPKGAAAGQQEATRWSEGSASLLLSTLRSSLFLYWFMAGFTAAQAEFAHARRYLATRQAGTFLFSLSCWFCYADKDAWRLFLEGPVMNWTLSLSLYAPLQLIDELQLGSAGESCLVLSSARVFVCERVHLFCVVAVFESANGYSIDAPKRIHRVAPLTNIFKCKFQWAPPWSLSLSLLLGVLWGTLGNFNYLHVNRWQWPREIFNCPWSLKPQI